MWISKRSACEGIGLGVGGVGGGGLGGDESVAEDKTETSSGEGWSLDQ